MGQVKFSLSFFQCSKTLIHICFSYLPELQCYNLILLWSKINDKFSIVQSVHFPSVHVKILLRTLYDLLSDTQKRMLCIHKPITKNIKLWTALGIHSVPGGINDEIIAGINIEIETLFKTFFYERREIALYKLVCYF